MRLVLSDGKVFEGRSLGSTQPVIGEVVFNTGMTGYQEILTDPSYGGQLVCLTYPLIGNYGVNPDDFQSDRLQPRGLIVREACEQPSNWRANSSLHDYLSEQEFTGIQGIDTRALTRHIRSSGVLMGAISDLPVPEVLDLLAGVGAYEEQDYVYSVSTKVPYAWGISGREPIDQPIGDSHHKIVALDCGLKANIPRRFASLGVRTIVLPCTATAEEVMAWEPDGILLSPGPGDPAKLEPVVETVRNLLGQKPIFGICLGNQLLCHAVGGRTYKLKFGHRGANHPVKDLIDDSVTITSQNHGYAIDPESLKGTGAKITQLNLNDHTVEGIVVPDFKASGIQYHPEAAPGPWDSRKYFAQFVDLLG